MIKVDYDYFTACDRSFDKTRKAQCHEGERASKTKSSRMVARTLVIHSWPKRGNVNARGESIHHVRQLHFQSGARKKNGNGIRFGRENANERVVRGHLNDERKSGDRRREIDSRVGQYIHWLRRPHDVFALCTSYGAISCVLART